MGVASTRGLKKNNPRQQCKCSPIPQENRGLGNTALYSTVLPFITSQVILIRGVRSKTRKRGSEKRGQIRVARLSVTVRSSLRPPVPPFPCPPSFPFSSHQWIHTSAHSHTCKQAFTHLYMQISGGCCFSRVKKQHHLSMA